MPRFADPNPADLCTVLLETYAANDAMNQLLLAHLDPRAWRAEPPGARGQGRTIGAIFAHLHNARIKWLRLTAPHLKRPARLDPYRCTMKQAATGLRQSAAACLKMLTGALSSGPKRRITRFERDGFLPSWPAGATMFAYMFAHEAHHRGQIAMLAHQLGYRLPVEAAAGLWWWEKLWKQAGLSTRPR